MQTEATRLHPTVATVEAGAPKLEGDLEYFSSVRSEIAPLLPARIGGVLEIGCGSGATMAWLRSTRPVDRCIGVEIVPKAAERARGVFDTVLVGSIDDPSLPLPAEPVDLILALDVLEHLPQPDGTLARLRHLLAPGGLFLASLPNVANFNVSWPLFFRGAWDYADEGHLDRTHLRFFSHRSALALFEDAGMTVERVEYTFNYPNLFSPFGWHGQSARWYSQKLLRRLPLVPRHMVISQFLIAARVPAA